ncbi:MAG: WG repeat-containing protein, partial [Clostridia bacterium]|nr:WG repeat-containing protein [Clostridia bacterium]
MIRNKIISAILSGVLCLSFAACSNNASPQIQPTLSENAETKASEKVKNELPKELYPAYIMQGTEKKWGFINRQGEFIIKPEYERTEDFFENGLARVTRDGKVGLIDRAGKLVVEPKYSYISDYSGKIVIASEDWTKDVILNEKGEEVFSIEGSIRDFSEGLAPFRQKTGTDQFNWGYLNEEGKVVIEPNYKEAQGFKNGKALVQISEDHYGIIDTKGKLVNEIQNDRIISLSEDTLIYLKKGTEGYRSGYMAIDG